MQNDKLRRVRIVCTRARTKNELPPFRGLGAEVFLGAKIHCSNNDNNTFYDLHIRLANELGGEKVQE